MFLPFFDFFLTAESAEHAEKQIRKNQTNTIYKRENLNNLGWWLCLILNSDFRLLQFYHLCVLCALCGEIV